jgi:hypothetical protein
MPTALFAALCWSGVKVEGGVGGSAEGKGIMSTDCQSVARKQVIEQSSGTVPR